MKIITFLLSYLLVFSPVADVHAATKTTNNITPQVITNLYYKDLLDSIDDHMGYYAKIDSVELLHLELDTTSTDYSLTFLVTTTNELSKEINSHIIELYTSFQNKCTSITENHYQRFSSQEFKKVKKDYQPDSTLKMSHMEQVLCNYFYPCIEQKIYEEFNKPIGLYQCSLLKVSFDLTTSNYGTIIFQISSFEGAHNPPYYEHTLSYELTNKTDHIIRLINYSNEESNGEVPTYCNY